MKLKLHHLLLTLGLTALSAVAQVPGIISHQGKVTVNGTNYTGSGLFKFALVDASGTNTYWSNDGSSSGGAQPTSAVTLPAARGVFSVNLGDTNLANMTQAIPASVFTNSAVYLRAWFNDGVNGSQLLTPDRRIVSVGYALNAGSYAETDPVYNVSVAHGITSGQTNNWSTAYGWGNHATAGYLTNFTETDPIFFASPAHGIAGSDITAWNGKVTGVTASSPLASSGGTTPNLTIQTASGSQTGALASGDWTTFNNKLGGSGTAGYVSKFTASGALSNSVIYAASTNVGIGTATPDASAKLDLTSTNQGFLPPRMTVAQQNAITNPATGLLVWCTDAGTAGQLHVYLGANTWYNLGPIPPKVSVGDQYQGGIIGYLLLAGDPGYDPQVQHGIVAATNDLQYTTYQNLNPWQFPYWANGAYYSNAVFTAIGATNSAIGSGYTNCAILIASSQGGAPLTNYFAGLAQLYSSGGYTNWCVPSYNDMVQIYNNRSYFGNNNFTAGGATYFTSTEFFGNGNYVSCVSFSNGGQVLLNKSLTIPQYGVRFIHYF